MNTIYYSYFLSFLHPVKIHKYFKEKRTQSNLLFQIGPLRLADENDAELVSSLNKTVELEFIETMGVSWIFVILKVLYLVIGLILSLHLFGVSGEEYWSLDSYLAQRLFLILALSEVVFFPIVIWIYAKIWKILISFFIGLFANLSVSETKIVSEQIIISSLSTHIFLAIPIFGGPLRHISGLIYIFLGLRNNLSFSRMQATLTLISPLALIGLIGLIFFMCMMLLVVSSIF